MKYLYRLWFWFTKPAGLINWLGDGAKHVSQQEAERRAKICMGCPNMVHGNEFVEVGSMIIKNHLGLKVEGEKSLKTCRSCGCFLPTKIWVPYEHIKSWQPEQVANHIRKVNGNCWQL